jgi:hypothetical protein
MAQVIEARRIRPQPEGRAQPMTRYTVPDRCIRCGTAGAVELTARTTGGAVTICCVCRACQEMWPATPDEHAPERRTRPADRRRHTRTDRRKGR